MLASCGHGKLPSIVQITENSTLTGWKADLRPGFWIPRRVFKHFSLAILHTLHGSESLCLIWVENLFLWASCGHGKLPSNYGKFHTDGLKSRFKTGFWVPRRAFKHFSLAILHIFHGNRPLYLIWVENPFVLASCGHGKLTSNYRKFHIKGLKSRF